MKTQNRVHPKGKPPKPGMVQLQDLGEGKLSKDEKIDVLARTYKECMHLTEGITHQTQDVLMFLEKALDQDDPMELSVHKKDGEEIPWSHSGPAVVRILRWLTTDLFECWNEVDRSMMNLPHELFEYVNFLREKPLKAATSRQGRSPGGAA